MRAALATLLAASLLACGGGGGGGDPGDDFQLPDGPSLRSLAAGRIHIGTAVASSPGWDKGDPLHDDPHYAALLADQYDILVAENVMKFDQVEPSRGTFDFTNGDAVVDFAEAHDMLVRGHCLLWHSQSEWLWGGGGLPSGVTAEDLPGILENHVSTVVGHWAGRVHYWDVVNEAIRDDLSEGMTLEQAIRDDAWARYYPVPEGGTRYSWIADAFRIAHEADPDAKLFYNEYGAEGSGGLKPYYTWLLVKQLQEDGVPIHGVGLQMHIGLGVPGGFADQLERFTDLGLEVHVTEADVRLTLPATPAALAAQKATYEELLLTSLANPGVTAFLTWGLDDGHSWIPDFFTGSGAALPFDAEYKAKPAFYGLREALQAP